MDNATFLIARLLVIAKKHKITGKMLAKELGVHHQSITNWHCGTSSPTLNNYILLCKVLKTLSLEAYNDLQSELICFLTNLD